MKDNEFKGFYVWMYKHRENTFIQLIGRTLLFIMNTFDKIKSYFERDISVYVNYVHSDGKKEPYTINGFVIRKGVAHGFSNIPWEDIDRLINQLREEDKPLILDITHGMWHQEIFLPVWARRMLADKLEELKNKHE